MDLLRELLSDPSGFVSAHQLLIGQVGINALLALSLFLTLGTGLLSLANVGFMAIGGYVTVLLQTRLHLPSAADLAAGSLAAGLVAVPIGLVTLRLSGVFLAIATLAFGQLVLAAILNLPVTGEGQGLVNPDADPSLVPVLGSLAVILLLLWRCSRGPLGLVWAAIREDTTAAMAGGIDVRRHQQAVFVAGALLAGYAGGLESHLNFFVDPSQYPFSRVVSVLVYCVFGGAASVLGPPLGALFLTVLPEVVRFARDYRDAVNGAVLLGVVLLRPQGLVTVGSRTGTGPRRRARRLSLPRRRAPPATGAGA